ncbi:uncharacterized protein EAE97_002798 [Botrytis byssoidea]|uniref:Rhodopsin domain-containing protein n=1 Tax=Botrytis byssoidea TaxID=139641 RepID=A0A9P5IRV8_9HELO|nr:uncharacterized protein EAE97_002798 [Botrytis byssoidea]KAF7951247.1 hypothetical protein EAE97_002798 [Botrytis byssoidea]
MAQGNLGEIFSNLPSSTLEDIAAFQPPPGVTANWVNPDSHREILILIPTVMMCLMIICIIVRVWVVFWIMRPVKLRWSDMTFTLTVLVAITLYVVVILSATGNGTFGLHNWDFPVSQLLSDRNLITTGLLPWLTPLTLGLVKTTIFLTYMEIFRSMKWMNMACLMGLSFTVVWYSAITIAGICLAVPLGGEGWLKHLFTSRMIKQNFLSIPTAVVGLAIDYYLFILPMIALNKLKLTQRKRLGAGLIFATGFFAIVASVMSVVYRVIHGSEHGDNTWWLVPILSVTITETFIGFIIACAWHFAKFLRTYEQFFFKAGLITTNLFCCRCRGPRGENSVDPKSSEASDTVDNSKVSREKVKPPPKMYPGLDLTSRGGTVLVTELDENENIPNSKENHRVDGSMEHTHAEKSSTIGDITKRVKR